MALSKTRQSPSMVLDGAIHGANGFGEGHPPPLDSFRVARTGRAESRAKAEAETRKAAEGCLSCFQSIHAWRGSTALDPDLDLAFAHPSAAWNVGWHGWVRLTGTVSGMDAAAKPPRTGLRRVPGSLTHPGPAVRRHPHRQRLNLTAPRKCPPRPCRCRCTSSPCRTSADDGAGHAARSQCESHRSHPAGGPGRSHRPAD